MKKCLFRTAAAVFIALILLSVSTLALPGRPAQAAAAQECWGVFIGVSNYQYIDDLTYCDDDARELYQELSPVWGTDHVQLLTDSQATKQNILNAINWLAVNAGTEDTVMFTFSGHGSDSGSGYFCPYNSLTYSWAQDISSTELKVAFQPVHAGGIAVILDICHAGCFQNNMAGNGRVLMLACTSSESSYDSSNLKNGVYSYYVIKAIDEFSVADANHDYELTAEEIANYANPQTHTYEWSQNPVLYDGYIGGLPLLWEFFLSTGIPVSHDVTINGISYHDQIEWFWVPGSVHTVSVPAMVDGGSGTRWIFTSWDDSITSLERIITKGIFTANYDIERLLTVTSAFGETYGAGWYKHRSSAAFSVTPLVQITDDNRYVFAGWSGDYSGSEASASILMDGPKTVAANWLHEYLLKVNSEYGEPTGGGWYQEGVTAAVSVTSMIELPDTKHYFIGWSGDSTSGSSYTSLTMSAPRTVTANWRNEYLLTLNSAYGTLTGGGWYDEGETAAFSVTPYIELPDTRHYFIGWHGDSTATSSDSSLVMSAPKEVTADWRHEYFLTVNSEYGQPTGAGWYQEGQTASVSIEPVQGVIVRQIFTGWTGDLTDTQADSSLAINAPRVVTANWRTDYIQLYLLIGGIVVLVGIITTVVVLVRRRG